MLKVSRALSKSLFAAAALFFLAASFSCDNSSDSSGYSPSQEQAASPASPAAPAGGSAAAPEIQCITFKGSVQAPGALPASYAKALEGLGFGGTEESVEGLSKSARPDVTVGEASGLEFFATATAKEDGSVVNGSFDSPTSRNFEMPLAIGKTWNIVCGIRNVSGDKKIVMSDSFQMEVTVSNSVLSHVFTLTPYTEVVEGVAPPSGDIALIVNHSGNALSVSASWEDPAGLPALTVESPSASPSCIKASGVPVGNHRLAIFFKDINGISIYESVQVVTVLNGLTTETWMPESGEAAITADGFNVGNDLIQGATGDRIYVGIPAALKGNPSVTASDTNSGSAYSPLEHLQAAFEKILSAGSGSKDFKIFVSGEVEGNATLAAAKGFNARSVTIEGLDDLDESKKPKSALKGSGSGSVFAIESNVPVTLKNIKITGGKAGSGSNGGGICAVSGSDLTIDSGVWITGNEADERGGGVSVAGKLLMKGGEISGNTAKMFGGGLFVESEGTSAIEAEICGSAVIKENGVTTAGEDWDGFGGGLYVGKYATVTMSGGEISANTAHRGGGGARVSGENAKFVLKGDGKITGNTAGAQGGGIDANHIVELLGGEISGNTAPKGGAVIVDGTFTIGGSARIPYGAGGATGAGKNDVYVCKSGSAYNIVQVAASGFSYAASDSAPAAVLAPQEWQRNYAIIKAPSGSDIGAYTPYFKTIDPDFYFGKLSGTVDTAKLKAALCVSNKDNAADTDEQSGTKSQPFKTIAFALTKLDAGEPDEIIIDYDPSSSNKLGPQSIPDTFTTANCSSLTIRGANGSNLDGTPKDIIDAGGSGSVLTVNSAVPITIKDLKITGGIAANGGGGITVSAGSVTLSDGVWITKNKGTGNSYCAGGARVASGAKLFMRGTALIGSKVTSAPTSKDACLAAGGNTCESSSEGGGILNSGSTFIGCDEDGNASDAFKLAEGYGVMGNWALQYGGGICNKGTLKIGSGEVSFNMADNQTVIVGLSPSNSTGTGGGIYQVNPSSGSAELFICGGKIRGNKAVTGGGVCISSGSAQMSGGTIGGSDSGDGNEAKLPGRSVNGGGVYIGSSGSLEMTGGTVLGNSASGNGGAVYDYGTFAMSGSASIPSGSDNKNDVYLCDGKTVTIAGALNPPSGVTKVAAITPDSYSRGRDILSSNSANATNLSNAIGKFKLSQDDDGWDRGSNLATTATAKKVWITSPIYVAGASGRAVCSAPPSDATKATGTKKMPYATIAAALKDTDLAYESNTITIDGSLSAQTIANTDTVANGVSAVTLQGYKASGAATSAAAINGGGTSNALSISKNLTYTIKDLQITNGKAASGGGINLSAGTVNLDSGAKVYSNKVTTSGAGVYVASGTTLNIKTGSEIYSNAADSENISGGGVYNAGTVDMTGGSIYNNTAYDGGGIYNYSGTLFVRGSAIIGAGSGTTATGSAAGSTCSNSASNFGGGIYNDSSANLYFGCNDSGETPTGYSLESSAGVRRNYAKNGGGIYNLGTFKSASGLISNNLASNVGGGMYAGGATNDIGGLGISNNQAKRKAGGLYVDNSKTATITTATGINSNTATQSSTTSDVMGGGIYIAGTLTVNETLNASSNSATITGIGSGKAYGGCVYIESGGKFTFAKGKLGSSSNELNSVSNALYPAYAYGGAVYNEGTFEVKGSGYVYPGSLMSNDVYLKSGKCVTVPANSYSGNDGTNKIALTLETWKRGTQVLDGSYAATYYNCFKCTDTEWSVGYKESAWTLTDDLKKRVGADIYVAGSSGRATGINAPPTTLSESNGTKAKPYSSISDGVKACWNSGLPFTINMSGKISGGIQTIPAADTTAGTGLASAITIAGVTGNSSDIIDRGLYNAPMDNGSALTISTATPVTLKNIKITNGYSKTHGGGILVNGVKGASLTLTTGALVTANQAKNNGGGIYFAGTNASGGTANLIMNSTSQISGNTAAGTSTNGGGGVYLSYANLYMSGSSVIGDTTGSSAATSAASGHSNAGRYGGGVYAAAGSAVYVGYKPTGTKDSAYATSCGILHNYSEKGGGGINVDGNAKLYLAYGSISKNGSGDSGGGAAIQSSGEMAMSGGAMALNSGTSGGAVVVAGSFEMTAGTIGDASKTSPATSATACSNYASSATGGGGAIWAVAGSSVTISGGTIAYNYAAKYGGAILAFGESSKTTSIGISAGTISANAAATSGGGLFIQPNVTATLSGTGVIKENSAATGGAVYVSSRGKLLIAGGGSIPKDTSKKNAVYLEPSSASDGTQIKITGNMTSDSKILLDGNASYFYKKDYSALTTQSPVNLTYNYTFFEIKNTSWSVCSDGSIQPATYLTSSNIASFTPTASTEYNFRIASGVTSAQLKSFFENLCNSECNTSSAKIKPTSTLDLSEVSLASLGMTFSYEKLVIQPFEMVVLPASVSATQLTDSRLVWCLSGSMDFSVPPTNTSLCSENGIVYNKSKTKLILYPGNKTGSSLPTLPNTLTTIGGNSFSCAQNLRTVNIPNTVTTIESGAFRHGKITSVSIPTSISSIPMECFLGCENLATVQLPNTLTTINSRAFQQCGISSININTGALTTIDYNAFDRGFSSTTNVSLTVPSTVKLIGSNAFASNSRLSLSFYYTSGWKKRNLSDSDIEANWSNATTSDMTGTNFTSSSGSMCNYYVKRN